MNFMKFYRHCSSGFSNEFSMLEAQFCRIYFCWSGWKNVWSNWLLEVINKLSIFELALEIFSLSLSALSWILTVYGNFSTKKSESNLKRPWTSKPLHFRWKVSQKTFKTSICRSSYPSNFNPPIWKTNRSYRHRNLFETFCQTENVWIINYTIPKYSLKIDEFNS